MKHAIIAAAALAASFSLPAQETLSTEVVVDRTVEPAERAAVRPGGLFPALVLPPVSPLSLSTASYAGFGSVSGAYPALAPAEDAALPPLSPYRGYASLGYFPLYNLGISAGYRLINDDRTRLGVYGQFDGETYKYKSQIPGRMRYNGGMAGVNLNQKIGSDSHLLLHARGGHAAYRSLLYDSQSLTELALDASWVSRIGRFHYLLGAGVGYDGFGKIADEWDSMHQTDMCFKAAGAYVFDRSSRAGLDIDGQWVSTSTDGVPTLGVVGFTPFFAYRSDIISARLGARLDLGSGGEGSKFHAAPQVSVAWTPTGIVSVYATATGGVSVNPLGRVRESYSAYLPGLYGLERSRLPYDIRLGFNVGPLDGLTLEAFGAYAQTKSGVWLGSEYGMPIVQADAKAFTAGIKAAYAYRKLFKIDASAQFAQSDRTKAWHEWTDRAKSVVNAGAEVYPLDDLTLRVGYDWRGGRSTLDGIDLGCRSDLRAGASYDFTETLGVSLDVENILGRRYELFTGAAGNRLCGQAAVHLKF